MLSWWLHHQLKTNIIDCTEKCELFCVPAWVSDGEARETPLGQFSMSTHDWSFLVELSSANVKDFFNASAVGDLEIVSEVQTKSA
jgi:hypothetical protein